MLFVFSSVNDKIQFKLLSVECSSFAQYNDNVGRFYAYISLDLSSYKKVTAVFPIGVCFANGGNGYDGIISPRAKDYLGTVCKDWTVTVNIQNNYIANFIVIGY